MNITMSKTTPQDAIDFAEERADLAWVLSWDNDLFDHFKKEAQWWAWLAFQNWSK